MVLGLLEHVAGLCYVFDFTIPKSETVPSRVAPLSTDVIMSRFQSLLAAGFLCEKSKRKSPPQRLD
jgi:hypothetical protein